MEDNFECPPYQSANDEIRRLEKIGHLNLGFVSSCVARDSLFKF